MTISYATSKNCLQNDHYTKDRLQAFKRKWVQPKNYSEHLKALSLRCQSLTKSFCHRVHSGQNRHFYSPVILESVSVTTLDLPKPYFG